MCAAYELEAMAGSDRVLLCDVFWATCTQLPVWPSWWWQRFAGATVRAAPGKHRYGSMVRVRPPQARCVGWLLTKQSLAAYWIRMRRANCTVGCLDAPVGRRQPSPDTFGLEGLLRNHVGPGYGQRDGLAWSRRVKVLNRGDAANCFNTDTTDGVHLPIWRGLQPGSEERRRHPLCPSPKRCGERLGWFR